MNQKFCQNIICDPKFAPRFLGVALLIVLAFVQSGIINSQAKQLKKLENQYDLVLRIDEFEDALGSAALGVERPQPQPEPPPREMVLKGMGGIDGNFHVIINDNVYGVGDMFDDILILRITRRTVTIKNTKTNEIKTLSLPEFLPE